MSVGGLWGAFEKAPQTPKTFMNGNVDGHFVIIKMKNDGRVPSFF